MRLQTDTREDFLETDDEPKQPSWNPRRACQQADTSPEILTVFAPSKESCETLTCSECTNPVILREDVYQELSQDLKAVNDASLSGEPLCVSTDSYRIFNAIYAQESEPDLTTMKHYENNLEGLVRIEYRCPRCRNCQACRDAHDTERISLKEEAEEAMIRESVKLDYENKRFICELPLRGKPEEFLTTNKHDAAKILERQVRLYYKEEDTKKLIVKAMDKLFIYKHV